MILARPAASAEAAGSAPPPPTTIVVTGIGGTGLAVRCAACVGAVAALDDRGGEQGAHRVLIADLTAARRPRGTLLASAAARAIEREIEASPAPLLAAARGHLCLATPRSDLDSTEALAAALDPPDDLDLLLVVVGAARFRIALDQVARRLPGTGRGALVAADREQRSLIALLAAELRAEGVALRAWSRPPGGIAARRAFAGIDPSGEPAARARRDLRSFGAGGPVIPSQERADRGRLRRGVGGEAAQALPAVLGLGVLTIAVALILLAIGGAVTAKGRAQRAVDLAAVSAARSMRDDFPRLFVPARRADGSPNPEHLSRAEFMERARRTALRAAARNGLDRAELRVRFPERESLAPTRVEVRAQPEIEVAGQPSGRTIPLEAEARLAPPVATAAEGPAIASGGGYAGPLSYRQGKPMRPDVALVFDRLAAAARRAGHSLVISSAFRSDAEQARLFAQNPDPRWVAPPGQSLHRCATELDLGPREAYGWLAANAGRFGFIRRYSWEPWHFGFSRGPAPCSAAGNAVRGSEAADGRLAGGGGLPGFVPDRYRRPLLGAASRHGVSAALLAAQLMAESNFNPNAVSPAGAQGIAQFMPGTAAHYGLRNPFDPVAAIDAQARHMRDLLGRFGSTELALAAYNAGSAPVAACRCVPGYPETQGYVARIIGLLGGAGALGGPAPTLEVRLVS